MPLLLDFVAERSRCLFIALLHLDYPLLAQGLEILRVCDHVGLLDGSLFLLLLLGDWRQVLDNDRTVINAADHMLHVVTSLELALREGALEEATLLVAKLTELVVSPHEEGSIVEGRGAVAAAASEVRDLERNVLIEIHEARDVLHEDKVLHMRHAIDAQLTS